MNADPRLDDTTSTGRYCPTVFVYGTLLCDEVVEGLLGRKMKEKAATLHGYKRVSIRRAPKAALGPVILPEAGAAVEGRVLMEVDPWSSRTLDAFESAAVGYERRIVDVELADGSKIEAVVYAGTDELPGEVVGEWDLKEFRDEGLKRYVETRIPTLKEKWRLERQLPERHPSGLTGFEAKQMRFLERQWEILEVFKGLRHRVPTALATGMLAITGFYFNAGGGASRSLAQALPVHVLIWILAIVGIGSLIGLRRQYMFTSDKIDHLYDVLGMGGGGFLDPGEKKAYDKNESAPNVFRIMAVILLVIAIACSASLLAPALVK